MSKPGLLDLCQTILPRFKERMALRISKGRSTMNRFLTVLGLSVFVTTGATLVGFAVEARSDEKPADESKDLLVELKNYPHKIVYESNRDGNWELYLCNADGSNPVNLTHTPDVEELFPKPSPDGSKICFVADEGKGDAKVRNLYHMNSDGSGRTKIAENAREPCWSPDGTRIAYLGGEFNFVNSTTAS